MPIWIGPLNVCRHSSNTFRGWPFKKTFAEINFVHYVFFCIICSSWFFVYCYIQISLADIMDLKIGWNGSKEEIALQEEFHGISPRHHCVLYHCHRLMWQWLITSGIFWLHVLSCIIYHRQLYWGRQKVSDSVLFDDVWWCLLLHVSEGAYFYSHRYQIVPFGWCTRRNLYGSQEWTDPLSFSGSVWGKGYLPLGWWSHGTIRLSIQE